MGSFCYWLQKQNVSYSIEMVDGRSPKLSLVKR